jgi:hypothetical protein
LSRTEEFGIFKIFKYRLFKHGPNETAFVTFDAACVFGEFQGGLALEIVRDFGAVRLVIRQTREAEQGVGDGVWSLVWQKIPVMDAAQSVDERNPHLAVHLKL